MRTVSQRKWILHAAAWASVLILLNLLIYEVLYVSAGSPRAWGLRVVINLGLYLSMLIFPVMTAAVEYFRMTLRKEKILAGIGFPVLLYGGIYLSIAYPFIWPPILMQVSVCLTSLLYAVSTHLRLEISAANR